MIAVSGLWLALAVVAVLLGALVAPVWAYVSVIMTLIAAAALTVGAGRRFRRAGSAPR
jgi:hypothetical protein